MRRTVYNERFPAVQMSPIHPEIKSITVLQPAYVAQLGPRRDGQRPCPAAHNRMRAVKPGGIMQVSILTGSCCHHELA